MKTRCDWCLNDPLYMDYHDNEWGKPVRDAQTLFEFLLLEGMQAGLSWITILKKRDAYRQLFKNFDPHKVARLRDATLEKHLQNPAIIRNRLKVYALRQNAQAWCELAKQHDPVDFLWQFTDSRVKKNAWQTLKDIPAQTPDSVAMSKALKKQGFTFVGPTICYAFMQATGMVNDHLVDCFCY